MSTIDLWEDNAGGLIMTRRSDATGWHGFERGMNLRAYRTWPRDEFTLASDAIAFDDLGDGSVYEPTSADDVERLYDTGERNANAPVRIATWEDGEITTYSDGSIGTTGRWYLGLGDP